MTATRVITIVDSDDNIITRKSINEVNYKTDIYRVSALWVTNKKGEVLLAQRSMKHHQPGLWGPAAAGTVEDETYEQNMIKEIEEELGIAYLAITPSRKIFKQAGGRHYFCQWFTAEIASEMIDELVPEEGEVETFAWIAAADLVKDVATHPESYLPGFDETVALFCGNQS
jgi:isopentenyldiphosphate isomerase